MSSVELARVAVPDFGMAERTPTIPTATYAARLERLRARAATAGFDRLVVYADREHSASLAWLTGFDPRFEEAILVVGPEGDPAVLVGNECFGTAGAAPLVMRRHLFQQLSLPDQPRDRSRTLREILADEGIGPGGRIGTIGWKTFDDPGDLEIPSYLADTLRRLVGAGGSVRNANGLLIDARDGLRTVHEPEQLAYLEWAATQTSSGVRRLLEGLRPGMTEQEAVALLGWNGTPLSCHLMLTAGPRAAFGLLSPSDRPIERGDPLTVAYGIWGGLDCRAGFVVEDASELPEGIRDYVDRLVAPYFQAVVEWYEALRVGLPAGILADIVARRLGDPFFGIFLNAGHLIGLDEWVASPIHAGSAIPLRSGMALQVDIIPATGTPYFTTNIEGGIALADGDLRARLAAAYPEAWARIQARSRFMRETLGIDLHADVLPLSNLPAVLAPFLLRPDMVMTVAR